jgi:hypothetical protein
MLSLFLRQNPNPNLDKRDQTYNNDGIPNPSDERFNPLLFRLIHEDKFRKSVFGAKFQIARCVAQSDYRACEKP